jgi:hAT family C-terminal dimerisation region
MDQKAQSQVDEVYISRYALHGRTVQLLSGHEHIEHEDSIQRAMRKRARISSDELTIYREGIVAHISADPLMWWKTHTTGFPGLSCMSLDMLAIPATTENVEMIFSQAKLILSEGRSVLDAELAGKMASLGSWQGCSNIRFGEFEFPKRQKNRFEFDSYEFEFELPFRNSIRAN